VCRDGPSPDYFEGTPAGGPDSPSPIRTSSPTSVLDLLRRSTPAPPPQSPSPPGSDAHLLPDLRRRPAHPPTLPPLLRVSGHRLPPPFLHLVALVVDLRWREGELRENDTEMSTGWRNTAYRARFTDGLAATVRQVSSGEGGQGKVHLYLQVQLLGRLIQRHVFRLCSFSKGHQNRSSFLHVWSCNDLIAFGILRGKDRDLVAVLISECFRFLVFDHKENRSLKG
jgi:hypothetical protein